MDLANGHPQTCSLLLRANLRVLPLFRLNNIKPAVGKQDRVLT